jgi:hypothetical protein
LLLAALTMIKLWDSGFKMVDEHAEESIDSLCGLYVQHMQECSSQRQACCRVSTWRSRYNNLALHRFVLIWVPLGSS